MVQRLNMSFTWNSSGSSHDGWRGKTEPVRIKKCFKTDTLKYKGHMHIMQRIMSVRFFMLPTGSCGITACSQLSDKNHTTTGHSSKQIMNCKERAMILKWYSWSSVRSGARKLKQTDNELCQWPKCEDLICLRFHSAILHAQILNHRSQRAGESDRNIKSNSTFGFSNYLTLDMHVTKATQVKQLGPK